MRLFRLVFIAFLCISANVNAQLSDFNLQVQKTDETCLGNGTLTFLVSNTTPGATMLYKIYHLPETANPMAIISENNIGSLSAGTYKVVAIQYLNDYSNSQEQTVTINNAIVPFNFTVGASPQSCSSMRDIIVTTTSGTAASYEIISGPETRPLQSSNVFQGLPNGTYNIRAFNVCGVGKVKTYTLSVVNSELAISNPSYPDAVNTECDSIRVNNTISATSGTINYPLTVQHTIEPLGIGGNPIVINQTFDTGSLESLEVSAVLPRLSVPYNYELRVTDNCNTVYSKDNNEVNPDIKLSLSEGNAPCAEKYLKLHVSKFTNSYTVNFLSAPDGFNPADFNTQQGGPFSDTTIAYGSSQNPVPFGNYVVEVTDACGRTVTESILIEFVKPTPTAKGINNGCFSEYGKIRIFVAEEDLFSATITAAPATYTEALPQDVSGHINSAGKLVLNDMPLGVYTIHFSDVCGFEYDVDVEVPPFVEKPFDIAALPACTEGYGSARVRSGNSDLQSVYIIQAPAGFGQQLPYNVSNNIAADGNFYMSGLIQGTYTFRATDNCGIVSDQPVNVEGYNPALANFEFDPNCGSFTVTVSDESNGLEGATFWLQKFDPSTGTWGHPQTGAAYTEGDIPTTTTGIKLNNNAARHNLNFNGKFRVIKKFESFSNASSENTVCVSELGEFTYNEGLSINTAYTLACLGQPNNVYLEVTGQPVSFKIVKKNGEPFVIDNGANNVFSNLEPAEYKFRVEDGCGNVVVKEFNMQELPSIADATQPDDMVFCTEPGASLHHEFHLTDQDEAILGPLFSSMYTITYYLTEEDADSGTNPLPEYYTNVTNGQTIYARLEHNEIGICHGITSFHLFVGEKQQPVIMTSGTICNDGHLALSVTGGNYSSYYWSTGETTRTIFVSDPGIYSVIVEKAYGNSSCDGYAEIEITASETPKITKVDTKDWTQDENSITVYTEGTGTYEYSIDGGVTYQDSNVFTGLKNGVYQVYVKDKYGCGEDIKEVTLLNYPNFFTPNGDGVHDKWRIEYSFKEPHLKVAIFDRYGKLITTFGPQSEGWDGTLNGIQLPSTDYWFVVTREDGRELRGHFAMLR